MTSTTRLLTALPVSVLLASSYAITVPANAAPAAAPAAVEEALRDLYASWGGDVRYFASSVDLNDDGRDEVIVHVVGSSVCGAEGCETLVFTPSGTGFQRVATIRLTHAPIKVSSHSTSGWRNLIVSVSGRGTRREIELRHDGESYPVDLTRVPVRRWARPIGEVIVPRFESPDAATLLISR